MSEILTEAYRKKLKLLNETIWEKKVTEKKINNWLQNFKDDEKIHALYLLTQFIYFNEFQVTTLLISVYRDLFQYREIEAIRKLNNDTLDETIINIEYKKILSKTRFINLGNISESSGELIARFRKANDLPISLFSTESDINTCRNDINHFVFIDDLCGSGTQATRYSKKIIPKIKQTHPNAKFSYLMLISTKEGKNKITNEAGFNFVDSVLELDSSYKCFNENSRVFKNKDDIIDIHKIHTFSGKYGKELMKTLIRLSNPKTKEEKLDFLAENKKLGFGNGQLILGFHHNTPNNTLPIFWFNDKPTQWTPIFKRINKKYKL